MDPQPTVSSLVTETYYLQSPLSFLFLANQNLYYRILTIKLVNHKKGTTMETIGKMRIITSYFSAETWEIVGSPNVRQVSRPQEALKHMP